MIRKIIIFALSLLSLLALFIPHIHAQTPSQGISLQISPLPIELNIKPGTSATTDLRVRNAGTEAEKLQVHLLKVSEDDKGVVHLLEPNKNDEWTKWVSFSQTVFDAPAGQWQTIKMTINVPKSAAFGYYFAVEYMRATEAKVQAGSASTRGAVATFILLNADVPGAKREAQVISFTADHHSYEFLPATFTVKIRATGNVHVAPHGNIFITRAGKQIGSIEINTAEGNILPHSSRFFSASWNDGFPHYVTKIGADGQPIVNKQGQVQKKLQWDFSKVNRLRFGRYTAKLLMVYDNGRQDIPVQASFSFWVIPWRLGFGLLLIIGFMAIGIWSSVRRMSKFINKRVKKTKSNEA